MLFILFYNLINTMEERGNLIEHWMPLLEMLGDVNRIIKLFTTSKGVFGRVDFREKRKWGEKTLWKVFGWKGERGKWWCGLGVFSLVSPKSFRSKMGRKLSGGSLIGKWQKCPCASAHGLVRCLFFWVWFYLYVASSLFSFSFHFSSGLDVAC